MILQMLNLNLGPNHVLIYFLNLIKDVTDFQLNGRVSPYF